MVQSTFRVLEEISRTGRASLKDVTTRTGVSKSSAFRILTTLCHLGYLVRDDRKRYCASPQMARLVSDHALADGLKEISLPSMIWLRDKHGETVNLGRLHHGQIWYVEVVPSEFALRLHETPGETVSLHASGLGRAILAFLPGSQAENLLRDRPLEEFTSETVTDVDELRKSFERIRACGYARDRGEISPLAKCVAAPILDPANLPVAALSISGPASRFDPSDDSPVIQDLLLATAEISERLRKGNR